ncbi:long-chain-fatty-acid--CoA ligase [Jatrophihabitans lederbergiae]|uniref:Long-chain-fatty-acid--CoA ligase n=1 Tax=Jatrophihabitans lederbergiae TaxID=3075547 RepID=A0ABU2JAX4_9ACTN|nr:long-chain-fatty-acid--CoA ligase [Jatrophihabitans sp. DSM 44399]MDT0262130.1 long-chain-fatty-acid--CoA ligase [Jatrophihabitans sp. DSM 44399]
MSTAPAPTLARRAIEHARERGDHPAIICEDRVVNYRRLHSDSNRVAHALRATGIEVGNRIGYLGKESEHYYTSLLACAKVGAVLVPVNWRLTPREVDHILGDSGAQLLMFDDEYREVVERIRTELPQLRELVCLDLGGDSDHGQGLRDWSAGFDDSDLPPVTGFDDAVVQIYTSGTSGLPKGVVLANRSFFTLPTAMSAAGVAWIDWLSTDVNLITLPGMGIAGIGWFMHGFSAGATNVIMRMFEPQEAVRLVRAWGVTTTFAAPAMLQLMLDERGVDNSTFASFRKIAYGAAPISEALLSRCIEVFGCELAQIYSSTEAGSVAVCLPPAVHTLGNPLLRAAGRPCPGNELKIVPVTSAPEATGEPAAPGVIGQVCIKTPAAMLEYWNNPAATAAALQDGWLHMGDLGYLDDDGYLFLCDRINDTIIVAGQNIYPAEVEKQLSEHPEVSDVAVFGVPNPRWGDSVYASVVLTPGATVTPRQLNLFLRGRLADYKLPTGYRFAERLPRNPAGKLLRREIRDDLLAEVHATEPEFVQT